MALDFPNSPSLNQVYSTEGASWIWNGSVWIREATITDSLNSIGDVVITSVAAGDFLRHDGSNWINDPVNLATDTVGNYVESLVAGTGITIINNSGEAATPNIAVDTGTIATKSYVDAVAAGLYWHPAVNLATTGALPNSPTYDNGTSGVGATLSATTNGRLIVDGGNASTGNRILVKNQVDATQNGIYTVTNQGSVSTTWELTRATDADNNITGEVATGDAAYTLGGSVNANQSFAITSFGSGLDGLFVLGTDDINWTQFSGTSAFSAGNGLTFDGNTINVVTADSSRIVANSDSIDLATVSQSISATPGYTSTFLNSIVVDSYGRVTGQVTGNVGQSLSTTSDPTFNTVTATSEFVGNLSGNVSGNVTGNADTATALESARVISLSGVLSGSESFDGSQGIAIVADYVNNSVVLGTHTLGNYVNYIYGGTGVTITGTAGEGATPNISIGQAVATTDNVIFASVTSNLIGDVKATNGTTVLDSGTDGTNATFTGSVTGNASTASTLQTSRTIELTGDVTGSGSFNGSSNLSISTTLAANSVALGADTTGDYVQSLVAGTGITLSNNSGESATPTIAVDTSTIATKSYVDSVAEGLHIHAPAKAATTATLASITGGSVTYDNGTNGVGATLTLGTALTSLDGYSLQNGDRIVVKDQANAAHNGIYTWATGGTVLTRASDFNTSAEVAGGDFIFVTEGSTYANTGWVETEAVTTFGTDSIIFLQFSGAGTYTAGTGLDLVGTQFSISSSVVTLTGSQTLSNKTITNPTLTLSTTTSTTEGRIAWDSGNDKIIVGDGSTAREFASSTLNINAQLNSYTLAITDKDKVIEISNSSANTLTVPPNSAAAFPIGSEIIFIQTGTGQTTITPGVGVTINGTPGLKLRAQWSSATLIKRGSDTWIAIGDLSA